MLFLKYNKIDIFISVVSVNFINIFFMRLKFKAEKNFKLGHLEHC